MGRSLMTGQSSVSTRAEHTVDMESNPTIEHRFTDQVQRQATSKHRSSIERHSSRNVASAHAGRRETAVQNAGTPCAALVPQVDPCSL